MGVLGDGGCPPTAKNRGDVGTRVSTPNGEEGHAQGNLYTGEPQEGRWAQKLVLTGTAPGRAGRLYSSAGK